MNSRHVLRVMALGAVAASLAALLFSLAAMPGGAAEEGKAAGAEVEVVLSRQEVLDSLPCFKCHSVEVLLGEPERGIFSHQLHSGFDIHCNQCHEVRGHEMPTINTSACGTCHALKTLLYDERFGAVAFNHEFHGSAFGCGECHPKPFLMKKGSSKMTMAPMYEGKFCGVCHNGQMAFSSRDCMKCHRMS